LKGTPAANAASRLRLLRDRTLTEEKEVAAKEAPYASMVGEWLAVFAERIRPPQ